MDLTQDHFNRLLEWLHPVPEEAAAEYESVRARLIRSFRSHDCGCAPEDLVDQTIDRVAKTLTPQEFENWKGPKVKKFLRVAYYIKLEHKKHGETELPEGFDLPDKDKDEDDEASEAKSRCLDKCLETLSPYDRNLIIKYYQDCEGKMIESRQVLARELNLTLPALRVKALRIREELKPCILKCLANSRRRRKTE